MIKTETISINGKSFIRTFSDSGYMVERDGNRYSEAIDLAELDRTYTETDEPIEGMTETEEKAKAYDIIVGVTE